MDQIVTRESISARAELAARSLVSGTFKGRVPNPYPIDTDAARAFQASLERWLLALSAPECEASA